MIKLLGWGMVLGGATLSATEKVPEGLTKKDWGSIRAAYEANRHGFYREADGSHVARNPGEGWKMKFAGQGFIAQPDNGDWQWGLELLTGVQSAESGAVQPAKATANRLSIQRSALVEEWYVNDGRGLEQGWTVAGRLQAEGPLRLELAVVGTLQARGEGSSLRFETEEGTVALTYGGLRAWDADGTELNARMTGDGRKLRVEVDDARARYPVTIDPIAQQAYVKASNTNANDFFGTSVAVSGDTVVVGAFGESSAATGVNGNQADNSATQSGAAYVFVRQGGVWTQQAYLKASNTGNGDFFGSSVAVSGDTVVVGALFEDSAATGVNGDQSDNSLFAAGAVYVFVRQGGVWSQQAYLKASNTGNSDFFGETVSVSGDTLVVGAPGEASAATGVNGNQADNTAADSGAVYVFQRRGSVWKQQAYLKASNTQASDSFGEALSISGDTVVVGAWEEDSAATGINGNQADNSASDAGAAYVFVRNRGVWTQQAYLKASNAQASDVFGLSVAVSGDTVVVGAVGERSAATGVNGNQADNSASNAGAAYVFVRQGGVWTQQAYLKASNTAAEDRFGASVAVSGNTVVVGAHDEDSAATGINGNQASNAANEAGAAYVFVSYHGIWAQQAYVKASNTGAGDGFGFAVAVSGDTLVVGAVGEASNATGINGNQADNTTMDAGVAYIFNLGEVLLSLAKTGEAAPGAVDLRYRSLGENALNPDGDSIFQSRLFGAGAARGGHTGIFTRWGLDFLSLQTGALVSGVAELPDGAKVRSVFGPIGNRQGVPGVFQATVSGRGVNGSNNRLLLYDNGNFVSPVLRTGLPIMALSGALPNSIRDVLQREGANDELALHLFLRRGLAGVTAGSDSGFLRIRHSGTEMNGVQEGSALFGMTTGVFGQMRRHSIVTGNLVSFISSTVPDVGKAVDGLFFFGAATGRNAGITQGNPAGGAALGETFRVFTGLTRTGGLGLVRATLSGSRLLNEGVWDQNNILLLRKGDWAGGAGKETVSRILRVWGLNSGQMLCQVKLAGTGVTARNNEALILRQANGMFYPLFCTGQHAPGVGEDKVTVARILSIAVNTETGQYAILGSLRGAPGSSNQALWSGDPTVGNDTTLQHLRMPLLRLRKGDVYQTGNTPAGTIRSLAIKPVLDRSGVGGRGEAQVINDDGQILVEIRTDGNIRELVRLTP